MSDSDEYKWEIEVYMEMFQLCFTPCSLYCCLDIRERKGEKDIWNYI